MNNTRDNIQLYYDFYIVAREGNMTSAAEKMCLSTSNLSKRISTLENILDLKLLNRTNRGISLTSDGEFLYQKLSSSFDNLNMDKDNEEFIGCIVIGTTRNIADNILAKYLYEFYLSHPKVEIKILTDSATNLNEYLSNHRIDVLIDYLPNINFLEKDGFEIKALNSFKTCFACNKTFYKKYGDKIKSLNDLKNYELIIPGSSRRRQMLDEVLQKNNVTLKSKMGMPDSKLMCSVVELGNFIGYFIEDEIKDTNLVKLDIKEELPINSYGVIYSRGLINRMARDFVELMTKK